MAYGVNTTNRSSGAPYADYFFVEAHTRFEKIADRKTKLTVVCTLTWEKPCLFKSKIETETWSGMKKFYEDYEMELQTEKAATGKWLLGHIWPF